MKSKRPPHLSTTAIFNLQDSSCNVIPFIQTKPRRQSMSRKHNLKEYSKKPNVFELSQAVIDKKAREEGPKRKTWSKHDLRTIRPLTEAQHLMFEAYSNNENIFAHGTTGTGKSFVALYLALLEVLEPESKANHIIIVRSNVATRNPGFLPGKLEEKIAPQEDCYADILAELVGKPSTYQDMKDAKLIQFKSTSFLRGQSWKDAIIIIDEFQNMNMEEFDSVITRVGKNCTVFILGDGKQNDLITNKGNDVSAFKEITSILTNMSEFRSIQFTSNDIVRSGLVKSYILTKEKLGL